ncbi:MAG: hypothetical protein IKC11_00045 [Clostridia bacterium]|nr:hypothetical protein [Clostridia bacterium]
MLNEYIASKTNQIKKTYRQKMASIISSKELQGRLDSLSRQLEELRKVQSTYLDESLSYRLLHRRQYAELKKSKAEAVKLIPEVKTQLAATQLAFARAVAQEESFRAEKRREEAKLRDKDFVIHHLMNADKSITNSIGFMLQCIEHNPEYIVYDTSNSNIVYEAFMKNLLEKGITEEKLANAGYTEAEIQALRESVLLILKEIQEPQTSGEEEYKVPQKYLYEVIRNAIKNDSYQEMIDGYNQYMSQKLALSKSFGIALDSLYKSKENYVFLHNVNYRGYNLPKEELEQRVLSICKNGLTLSSMGNEVGKLDYTTLGNAKGEFGFLRLAEFANSGYVIALSIPKKLIDENGEILGTENGAVLDPSNPGTVLPQYVAGVFMNGEYVPNPYKVFERKKFDSKTVQVEEKE